MQRLTGLATNRQVMSLAGKRMVSTAMKTPFNIDAYSISGDVLTFNKEDLTLGDGKLRATELFQKFYQQVENDPNLHQIQAIDKEINALEQIAKNHLSSDSRKYLQHGIVSLAVRLNDGDFLSIENK